MKSYYNTPTFREMEFIAQQKQTGTRRVGEKSQRKHGYAKDDSRNGHRKQ